MLIAVGLGGCSDPGTSPSSVVTASAGESAEAWDPRTWEPTVEISAPALSESDKLAFRDQWLARMAQDTGVAEAPDIALVRWTEGKADYGQAVGDCLNDAGFAAEWDGDWGFSYGEGIPAAQDAALALAWYTCHARFSQDPVFLQEWSADQLVLVFDYWHEYLLPCLHAHGVPVVAGDEPSRESWVAAFPTEDRLPWWPPSLLEALPEQQRVALRDVCAPYPPDDVFYGS